MPNQLSTIIEICQINFFGLHDEILNWQIFFRNCTSRIQLYSSQVWIEKNLLTLTEEESNWISSTSRSSILKKNFYFFLDSHVFHAGFTLYKSASIVAVKCNFRPFRQSWQTNQPTNRRTWEVATIAVRSVWPWIRRIVS